MGDETGAKAGRFAAGVVRIVISAVLLIYILYMLADAPWSRGGQRLIGYMIMPGIAALVVALVLPGGVAAVRSRGGDK